jgi:hypothetical protein
MRGTLSPSVDTILGCWRPVVRSKAGSHYHTKFTITPKFDSVCATTTRNMANLDRDWEMGKFQGLLLAKDASAVYLQ